MKEPSTTATLVEDPVLKSSDSRKFSIKRILAPTDFSPKSEKAVNFAIQLAQRLGAKLTLLHVVQEPSAIDYSIQGISIQEIQRWEEKAEKTLVDVLARARLQYPEIDALQVTALHPRDQIVQGVTDLSADLMVISTHGYTGWKHFLFGSDAEKIVQQAQCPVLIVR